MKVMRAVLFISCIFLLIPRFSLAGDPLTYEELKEAAKEFANMGYSCGIKMDSLEQCRARVESAKRTIMKENPTDEDLKSGEALAKFYFFGCQTAQYDKENGTHTLSSLLENIDKIFNEKK